MRLIVLFLALIAVAVYSQRCASTEVRPNPVFSDNAVIQRDVPVPVWGTAEDGERITVSIQDHKASTVAKNGQWRVVLNPLKSGGPFTMTISGKKTLEIKNVLVGEVWLASGQSNMQWPLNRAHEAESEIASSSDPMLRFTTAPRTPSLTPVSETAVKWEESSPQSSPEFSAVAYYFGKELRKVLGCPVGLIDTSWGGTRVETWMSAEALKPFEGTYDRGKSKPGEALNANQASVLYNGLISPLIPFPIKGAIWYQGESNAGRAFQYEAMFSAMITDWRKAWAGGDFPFLFVQLAPYGEIHPAPRGSNWAELREAQLRTAQNLSNTAMAVITDYGESDNIHPAHKKPVGERLAFAARALAYGEKLPYRGPSYKSLHVKGDRAVIKFDTGNGGLVAKGGDLTGFTLAGGDGQYYNARASIQGTRVVVSSPEVPVPVSVRYGWADCPVVNLFNTAGLPASPFRTDNYPLVSSPKK